MNVNSVGWFEIYVEDMKRARSFYEEVLGKKIEPMKTPDMGAGFEMCAFPGSMENYGANGALVRMPGFPTGKNSVLIYFSCDDCANEESRVVAHGGKVEKSKFSIGEYGYIALAYDTEGNMFGLHSMK